MKPPLATQAALAARKQAEQRHDHAGAKRPRELPQAPLGLGGGDASDAEPAPALAKKPRQGPTTLVSL